MLKVPQISNQFRLFVGAYGVALMIWLGIEDSNSWFVVMMGLMLTTLALSTWLLENYGGQFVPANYLIPSMILMGAIGGGGTSLVTALLMLMKNGWHAHVYPDFAPAHLLAILSRAPSWAIVGALLGFAFALILRIKLAES